MQEEEEYLHEKVKEYYKYNPETGVFSYNKPTRRRKRGDDVSTKNGSGYLVTRLEGKLYLVHRLIFLYMTAAWPAGVVDHKDTIKTNNKWENLRDTTQKVNGRNKPIQKNNKSGVTGVRWDAKASKWLAYIAIDGKSLFLGSFDLKEDAVVARMTAEKENGFWLDRLWDQL